MTDFELDGLDPYECPSCGGELGVHSKDAGGNGCLIAVIGVLLAPFVIGIFLIIHGLIESGKREVWRECSSCGARFTGRGNIPKKKPAPRRIEAPRAHAARAEPVEGRIFLPLDHPGEGKSSSPTLLYVFAGIGVVMVMCCLLSMVAATLGTDRPDKGSKSQDGPRPKTIDKAQKTLEDLIKDLRDEDPFTASKAANSIRSRVKKGAQAIRALEALGEAASREEEIVAVSALKAFDQIIPDYRRAAYSRRDMIAAAAKSKEDQVFLHAQDVLYHLDKQERPSFTLAGLDSEKASQKILAWGGAPGIEAAKRFGNLGIRATRHLRTMLYAAVAGDEESIQARGDAVVKVIKAAPEECVWAIDEVKRIAGNEEDDSDTRERARGLLARLGVH